MKKRRLKKKVIVILLSFFILIFLLIGLYGFSLKSVSKESEPINFTVQSGASKTKIVEDLKTAGLIRSKTSLLVYLFFNSDLNLQAGKYELNRNMDVAEILKVLNSGNTKAESIKITFVEGKNMNDYIKLISERFSYTENEIKEVLASREFMQELVEKYDFLTDEVLNGNIYYALEGYLFPDTYEFSEKASIKDIIIKILDNTKVKLASLSLENSEYTIHEILSAASIVELEAVSEADRARVAQVIFKRLEMGKGLGMDVTTYYAVKKPLGETLTMSDLRTVNPYNTSESNSMMAGKLPVGPICNPSLMSIKAVLNPSDTDYIYFYADIRTHEVFFANTYEEFIAIQREVG